MNTPEATAFLAVTDHYWGRGATLEEAVKNAKKQMAPRLARTKCVWSITAFACAFDALTIQADVWVRWQVPEDTVRLHFEVRL